MFREYYREMLKLEGKYIGSVFHKYEQETAHLSCKIEVIINRNLVLLFLILAMTLFTTIGYGSIACQTMLGKVLSIFYAMIGIPLMLVVLSDLGIVMLRFITKTKNFISSKVIQKTFWRNLILQTVHRRSRIHPREDLESSKCRLSLNDSIKNNNNKIFYPHELANISNSRITGNGIKKSTEAEHVKNEGETIDNENESENDTEDDSDNQFPLSLSIPLVVAYLLFISFIVYIFDYHDGTLPGLTYFESVYFSFFSLSTIGLGDVMPNNVEYSPLLAVLFVFGLALLSVVNGTLYLKIENTFLLIVDSLEDYLETVHYYRHGREGYFVFKSLGENIQLLALALPIFDDAEEEKIEAMLEPENTKLGRKIFNKPRAVSIAFDFRDTPKKNFGPTLGIWNSTTLNTANPKKRHSIVNNQSVPSSLIYKLPPLPNTQLRGRSYTTIVVPNEWTSEKRTTKLCHQQSFSNFSRTAPTYLSTTRRSSHVVHIEDQRKPRAKTVNSISSKLHIPTTKLERSKSVHKK